MSHEPAPSPRGLARAAMERETTARPMPDRRKAIRIPMHVRPSVDGSTHLVHAETGEIVSPCASPEIAERTKRFFS